MTFTRNEVRGTHLVFQKRRFQGFIFEILRVVGPLREKFTFLTPLGQPQFPEVSDFLFILMLSFSQTFQNNLNYASASNIGEVIKFYNLGDKTFETDFSL